MSRWTALLIIAACGASTGCITGFKHPLGPAEDGFIEPQLLGAWACTSTDEPKPSLITILDFDGKQYYIYGAGNGQGEPSHSRAFATRVEGVPFLSVRDIGEEQDDDWMFMEYVLPDADHLKLRLVNPNQFEDLVDDAPGVRLRLATLLEDPEVILDGLSCTRPRGHAATP